jgi:hypothetical protein
MRPVAYYRLTPLHVPQPAAGKYETYADLQLEL